jgi:hypothetical protein
VPVRHRGDAPLHPVARTSALAATLLLAAACSAGGGDVAPGGAAGADVEAGATTSEDPNALYEGFVDCEPLPDGIEYTAPEGLVVPDGLVVTDAQEVGPLYQLTGFLDATPIDIRDAYAGSAELVYLEDEGYEAEILIDSGPYRTFLKASIRCRTGSIVAVIGAPDDDGSSLPVPGQQGG